MYILELIGRMILNLMKQVWLLPQTFARVRPHKPLQTSEVERLDRIRQPWKYLGR